MVTPDASSPSAGLLAEILRSNNVYVGGSSMGKGFRRAARYYLRKQAPTRIDHSIAAYNADKALLNDGVDHRVEDPFLVVDMGMVVSQLYQWRQHFPRVEAFYAMKCNPDPLLVQALAAMGCHFDCASREEIRLVKKMTKDLPFPYNSPDIIYANPAKARSHIIEAVCSGVRLVTFDNEVEVKKCASISKHIQLVMRIITDDSGSQCRLSSKFGAPKTRWPALLRAAKQHGLQVVGVSFHVGSGCRDVTRYEMALRDARALFDMAESEEYGFKMRILDIGGGFPGETHSLWNPASVFGDPTASTSPDENTPSLRQRKYTIDEEIDEEEAEDNMKEGFKSEEAEEKAYKPLMYFTEIADAVTPMLDDLFPAETGVRIIAEPGRYLVAASCTLATSVISVRKNAVNEKITPIQISDTEAAMQVHTMTRAEEDEVIEEAGQGHHHRVITSIIDDLADYSKLYAEINLSQQEVDVYLDKLDLTNEDPSNLLAPPLEAEVVPHHSVEGMTMRLVTECIPDDISIPESVMSAGNAFGAFAGAGEAALSGVLKQVLADATAGCEDDFSYYVNDGVYGSFNNLMFDHATVRPRHLKQAIRKSHSIVEKVRHDGVKVLEAVEADSSDEDDESQAACDDALHPSTIFGPTCDSIDVIGRSVLLPKLSVGDWLYFQNMGAYTCAAASSFNGFIPTEKFYVCSIQPEHFERLIHGPEFTEYDEEKKAEQW